MRFLPHLIAIVALTLAGLFLYKLGGSNATISCEQAKTVEVVKIVKETVMATEQRNKVDHDVNKIPDTALDIELSAGGWLRD